MRIDPAIEAAQRVIESHEGGVLAMADIAREALKPIRDAMVVIKEHYAKVHGYMIAAETSAEQSRHASELAGLMFAYNLIAPSVFTSEEVQS